MLKLRVELSMKSILGQWYTWISAPKEKKLFEVLSANIEQELKNLFGDLVEIEFLSEESEKLYPEESEKLYPMCSFPTWCTFEATWPDKNEGLIMEIEESASTLIRNVIGETIAKYF